MTEIERQTENLESSERGDIMYKGSSMRLTADFSSKTMGAKVSGKMYTKCWKKKDVNQEVYI